MGNNVSVTRTKASRIAEHASEEALYSAHIADDGLLHQTITIDIDKLGLRRGKTETVLGILYEPRKTGGADPSTQVDNQNAGNQSDKDVVADDGQAGDVEDGGVASQDEEPSGDGDSPEGDGQPAFSHASDEGIPVEASDESAAGDEGVRADESLASAGHPLPGAPFADPSNGNNAVTLTRQVSVPKDPEAKTVKMTFVADLDELRDTDAVMLVAPYRNRKPLIALCCALAAIILAVALVLASWGDPRAKRGYYEGKSDEEIRADLDSKVDWYSMEISCASAMKIYEGETEVEARLENVVNNHCDQKVRMYLTNNPEDVLYESGAISPGEYIQTVPLNHALPIGRHAVTVEFQGYEQSPTIMSDEGKLLGHDTFGASCAAQVTIEVMPAEAKDAEG